jgi:hypothetical protein
VSRKAALWVVVGLVLASVFFVVLADVTTSYVPLFFCWIPQAFIPWVAAKTSQDRPAN